jgi:MFS family permease
MTTPEIRTKGITVSVTSSDTGTTPGIAVAARGAATGATAGQPPRRLGLALAVIATAQLMIVLDSSIVNVALPHIQNALGFSDSSLEWVVNAYTLAFGGLLLLGGRSGDLLGRRRIFIAGIVVFTLASLVGGCSRASVVRWPRPPPCR